MSGCAPPSRSTGAGRPLRPAAGAPIQRAPAGAGQKTSDCAGEIRHRAAGNTGSGPPAFPRPDGPVRGATTGGGWGLHRGGPPRARGAAGAHRRRAVGHPVPENTGRGKGSCPDPAVRAGAGAGRGTTTRAFPPTPLPPRDGGESGSTAAPRDGDHLRPPQCSRIASISTRATSGRLNSGGGVCPWRSISRTRVPERLTWCSSPCGQVFSVAMLPQRLQ